MPYARQILLLLALLPFCTLNANAVSYYPIYAVEEARALGNMDFSLIKRGVDEGIKVFIAGGIQGDEPGGFTAASIISSHYRFMNAQIYISPNLNLDSIIKRSRGASGDMNRKFSALSKNDPQYDEVQRLQDFILDFKPNILLNLHDGSGFYATEYISSARNPNRWGQSVIIDQESMDCDYGDLEGIAERVTIRTNEAIENKNHYFVPRNTHTNIGHAEMEKSLSWYGVRNGIPSFGLEVSKDFNKATRVYYHLVQLEAFFDELGIEYYREFPLTLQDVANILEYNVYLKMANGRIFFPLQGLKNQQSGYIPVPKDVEFYSAQPIVATIKNNSNITVYHGNNTMTRIPVKEYVYSENVPLLQIDIDGTKKTIELGSILHVKDYLNIEHIEGYRINAIGARAEKMIEGLYTEAEVELRKNLFDARYSIDKAENIYRVEMYEGAKFVGMFLVDFSKDAFVYEVLKEDKELDFDAIVNKSDRLLARQEEAQEEKEKEKEKESSKGAFSFFR